jgi:ATP synthase F1 gamma subunit
MRRPQEIDKERLAMTSIVQLTGAFEGIASAHIARIKTQVQQSELFFKELWATYTALRVGKEFHSGHTQKGVEISKDLIIIITAEGSLSGDIDQRLIEKMLEVYRKDTHDLIVVGHHGSVLLDQRRITPKQAYRLPEQGQEGEDVTKIVQEVQRYKSATVFYQAYLSLMNQDIKSIALSAAVQERGEELEQTGELEELITDVNYIFEPSIPAVVDYMERSMLGVALSEVILESKLAQQASRFRAMSTARSRARDSESELTMQFNHAGRAIKDERTKEIVSSVLRHKHKKGSLTI